MNVRIVAGCAFTAAAALALVAGGATAATPAPVTTIDGPVEYAPGDATFFEAPDPIPESAHGRLLRFQLADPDFGEAWRIMYVTTSTSGQPSVATALVNIPEASDPALAGPPFGGFPVLLYAHGTVGFADACAPSRSYGEFAADSPAEFEGLTDSEPWVIVAADLEGLGTPGPHPYLVGASGGRSLLDAGLAARQFPGLYTSDATALVGYEAGGHAALWAAQLAAEWTPTQRVVGTVAGAPVADPGAWIGSGRFEGRQLPEELERDVAVLYGLVAASPETALAVPSVLTPAGLEVAALQQEACGDDASVGGSESLLDEDAASTEPFASLLRANVAGTVATPAPVLVLHGPNDYGVPAAQSEQLVERLCAAGQTVDYRTLSSGSGQQAIRTDGLAWLTGLVDGTVAPASSC